MHLSTIFVVSAIATSAVCALPLQGVDPSTSSDVLAAYAASDGSGGQPRVESSLHPRAPCITESRGNEVDGDAQPARVVTQGDAPEGHSKPSRTSTIPLRNVGRSGTLDVSRGGRGPGSSSQNPNNAAGGGRVKPGDSSLS
ncbi:hypothetical protein FB446DRAFT_746381 [Lentinula raphanica]|nr:hypothetical protein FB446DRAFT_746381 [Lentinula raphanica]